MKVIHFIDSLAQEKGGPSRSASNQCLYTSRAGATVDLAWPNHDRNLSQEALDLPNQGIQLLPVNGIFCIFKILKLVTQYDVVHVNGIWRSFTAIAALASILKKKPLVITPHGMLEPWSLNQKKVKKKIALHLYEKHILKKATVLHATAKEEALHFKLLKIDTDIAVIPNGVVWPKIMPPPKVVPGNFKRLLFMSRMHPKKGILELLNAIASNRMTFKKYKWILSIAGPDEDGYQKKCQDEAKNLKIDDLIEWLGPVVGIDKWSLYRSAKAFILPTYSENFGIVIAEALSAGVPVMTTHAAPWKEIERNRCGWWVPMGQESINLSLERLLKTNTNVLKEMGKRGRSMCRRKYGWPKIGKMLVHSYMWMLGQANKPEFVEVVIAES